MPSNLQQKTLSTEQKVSFTLLLVFALLAISLGFLQIRNTLYKSFAMHQVVPFDIKDQIDTIDSLRFRDTDQDGLTDFDELYLYNTSRYLDDTDSDGILDGDEVGAGSNPLCAEGENCGTDISQNSQGIEDGEKVNIPKPSLNIAGIDAGDGLVDLRQIFNDPERIRLLLIESGMSKDEVNELSDEELLEVTKSYRDATEQGANTQEQLEAMYEVNKNTIPAQEIKNSDTNNNDIESIRNTLLQNGIPADVLNKISDDQILEYLEQNQ